MYFAVELYFAVEMYSSPGCLFSTSGSLSSVGHVCKVLFCTIDYTVCIVKFEIEIEIESEIGSLLKIASGYGRYEEQPQSL